MVRNLAIHTNDHAERPLGSPERSEGARIEVDWSAWAASTSKIPRNVTTMLENDGNGRDPRHPCADSGRESARAEWLHESVVGGQGGVTVAI